MDLRDQGRSFIRVIDVPHIHSAQLVGESLSAKYLQQQSWRCNYFIVCLSEFPNFNYVLQNYFPLPIEQNERVVHQSL